MNKQKLLQIVDYRNKTLSLDTEELHAKREKFMNWMLVQNIKMPQTCELYVMPNGEVVKSHLEIPQFLRRYHNTRTKTQQETCAEIDKLSIGESIQVMGEIVQSLIRNKIHFALFYAEGQRSPHIRIYDLEELEELDPFKREKAQALFWRKIVPFFVHYLDASMWQDEHLYCLEFAIHWKYGTPFNLVFEWIPEGEKCNH